MTDHSSGMPGGAHHYHFYNLRVLPQIINGVRVLKGVEANIMDFNGRLDVDDELLSELDLVIASFHPPCIEAGSTSDHTRTLSSVCENPRVHIIGHPGDSQYGFDLLEIVRASKATSTLLEINNTSLTPASFRPGGKKIIKEILTLCALEETPVVLGSDAHFSSDVGRFTEALALIQDVGFPEELIVNFSVKSFSKYVPSLIEQ